MPSISNVTRLKILLRIPEATTTYDDLLAQVLDGVEAVVESYCGRQFASSSRVEYYGGESTSRLFLRQYPVTSVTSVRLDLSGNFGQTSGSFAASTALTAGVDYALELDAPTGSSVGVLRRLGGPGGAWRTWPDAVYPDGPVGTLTEGRAGPVWPAVPGSVKVAYVAGYTTIPGDLALAVDQIAARVYREGQFGGSGAGIVEERLEDYAYKIGTIAAGVVESLPAIGSPRSILNRYKRIVL